MAIEGHERIARMQAVYLRLRDSKIPVAFQYLKFLHAGNVGIDAQYFA